MKKTYVAVIIVLALIMAPLCGRCEGLKTLYDTNGGIIVVESYEVSHYIASGWYEYPVVKVYSYDGREAVIPKSSLADYEKVGWIDGTKTVEIYNSKGESAVIPLWQLQAYQNVGWFDGRETVTIYTPSGESAVIPLWQLQAYQNVGWIDGRQMVNIYSLDGKSAVVPLWQLQAYRNVGWYDYPVVAIYSVDGRNAIIAKSALADYENAGWRSASKPDATFYDFLGEWNDDSIGGYGVFIFAGDNDTVNVGIMCVSSRTLRVAVSYNENVRISNGVARFYVEDSWGVRSHCTLRVVNGRLECSFDNTQYGSYALWSVAWDGKIYCNKKADISTFSKQELSEAKEAYDVI